MDGLHFVKDNTAAGDTQSAVQISSGVAVRPPPVPHAIPHTTGRKVCARTAGAARHEVFLDDRMKATAARVVVQHSGLWNLAAQSLGARE